MDRITELLDASAPRRPVTAPAVSAALSDMVESSTRKPRFRRPLVIAGLSALFLGAGTAAAAAAGLLFPILPPSLLDTGDPYDFEWTATITVSDEEYACSGGFVLIAAPEREGFNQTTFDEARKFIQTQDWSEIEPDAALVFPSGLLLGNNHQGAAEHLSRTIKTQVITATQAEFERRGTPVGGFDLRGIDECTL
ncbi:hypothetical protein V6245_00475 [Salinibacterium amurskyense]|uniref:hypothetical protein n=1 Tax=Salinibacterium amurskyense TaxID=205941 RepID=UPI00311DCB0E